MGRTHYDVLGITPGATPTLLRAAYKARIRETHPDNGGDPAEAASVNAAFQILNDEYARSEYDRTLTAPEPEYPPGAAQAAAHEPWEQAAPARPVPSQNVPLWRRGNTARALAITAGAWLVPTVALSTFAGSRAAALGQAQPEVIGFLTGFGSLALIVITVIRTRWWIPVVGVAAYSLFTASQGTGGFGTLQLVVTTVACAAVIIQLRSARRLAALERVGDFWAAAAHPDLSGWFITRALQDTQTCLVQITDVTGQGRPDTSAMLWGHHAAGTYVITDLTTSPGTVLVTVSTADMKLARKGTR